MLNMRTNEGIPYHKWYFGLLEQATKKRSQKISKQYEDNFKNEI